MSTIMYKFKSGTNFESISMPGTTARLFDIKRAIVKANKLDRSTGGGMQLEFDISVKNAMTDEEYTDENMLLPRGTRIIVQRLPAARGQGLLARIARADAGMHSGVAMTYGNVAAAENGFYTIQSARDDDDEFVSTKSKENDKAATAETDAVQDSEEKELAALKAVTDQAGSVFRSNTSLIRSLQPSKFVAATVSDGQLPQSGAPYRGPSHSYHPRPNADPELREQERLLAQQAQPTKRRATGIPRTFLNIPPPANAADDEEPEGLKLQPNVIGFEALVTRGGGQSGSSSGGKRRDLDYALKLTATEIPEHLQCGICAQVVKNAMLVPWDTEGRAACEICMRDGLAKSGFVCPLTGQEGVSPDDLIPNVGLRKAADLFVKDVMEKMDKIIQQQEADEEQEREKQAAEAAANKESNAFEGDELDKGLVLRKGMSQSKGRRHSNDFGDDFGGDVFEVEEEEDIDVEKDNFVETQPIVSEDTMEVKDTSLKKENIEDKSKITNADDTEKLDTISDIRTETTPEKLMTNVESQTNDNATSIDVKTNSDDYKKVTDHQSTPSKSQSKNETSTPSRKELLKNRAPPAGYQMGPAMTNSQEQNPVIGRGYGGRDSQYNSYGSGGRPNYFGGRGRGRFQRIPPTHNSEQGRGINAGPPGRGFAMQGGYDPMLKGQGEHYYDAGSRSGKRPHSEIEDFGNQGGGRFQGAMPGGRWHGRGGDFGRSHPGERFGHAGRGSFRGAPPSGRGGRGWDARGPGGRFHGRGRY